ncbi:MAG TPA: hypothetical protein VEP90_28825 [Methylomirabilota bacterium]|nr:hypothetical protein [Methylomirabilota bacterium]
MVNHVSPLKSDGVPNRFARAVSEPTRIRCKAGPQRNTPAKAAGVSAIAGIVVVKSNSRIRIPGLTKKVILHLLPVKFQAYFEWF